MTRAVIHRQPLSRLRPVRGLPSLILSDGRRETHLGDIVRIDIPKDIK